MSDAILRLERRRHLLLLRPGCDGRLATMDLAIQRRYQWLDCLEQAERQALRHYALHRSASTDAAPALPLPP